MADCILCAGSFSRQRPIACSMFFGRSLLVAEIASGVLLRIDDITADELLPLKGRSPVDIS